MNRKNRSLQGMSILLFAIYCAMWAMFLHIQSLGDQPPVTVTAQKVMYLSIPVALIGIGWIFWPRLSRSGESE